MASAAIHTNDTLDPTTRSGLIEQLNAHSGVRACSSYDKSPQVLIVEYDAEVVTGHDLLQFVLDAGVKAHMIG